MWRYRVPQSTKILILLCNVKNLQEQIKDINIYYVLLMYSLVKYGLTL